MLSFSNIVGRWDYYSGQKDVFLYVLNILKNMLERGEANKTCGQLIEHIEEYINEPFEEYDENSHYYKDGKKDILSFFHKILIPLSYPIKLSDIPEIYNQIHIKYETIRNELNSILQYLSR
jgi:hypothetical protein